MYFIYAFFILFAIAMLFLAFVSYNECVRKTFRWHGQIAHRLVESYHLKNDIAVRLVQLNYPLHEYKFKTHIHPDLAAADLFWKYNDSDYDQDHWHYWFYNEKGHPTHLFDKNNFGRVFLEA